MIHELSGEVAYTPVIPFTAFHRPLTTFSVPFNTCSPAGLGWRRRARSEDGQEQVGGESNQSLQPAGDVSLPFEYHSAQVE